MPTPFALTTLVLMLLLMGVISVAAIVVTLAIGMLRPPRMSDGKAVWVLHRLSPGDLGLRFEEVAFNIRDEHLGQPLRIAGWWIGQPLDRGKCVVLLHGYADAKVGAIAWAPLWHRLGFNILAIDLRAHGESGGTVCSAGYWERADVSQVLDQVRSQRDGSTRRLVLFGVSMGAVVAAATAALRTDLSAVVLESPPGDFPSAAMRQMDRLGAPGKFFQLLAVALAGRLARADWTDIRPGERMQHIAPPVMVIAPSNDPLVSEADRQAIANALGMRHNSADVFWPVDAGHVLALHADWQEYEQRLRSFLQGAGV